VGEEMNAVGIHAPNLLIASIDEAGRSWCFYLDGQSEAWIAGPKLPRFLPVDLKWQIGRFESQQWIVRVRNGWHAVLFRLDGPDASGEGISGAALRSLASETDGGWEFALDQWSSVLIHTECWKLHLSLVDPESVRPGGRLVLHQGEMDVCLATQKTAV